MDATETIVNRARGRVGRVLKGKYRLDVLLGIGGMAAVYAATHRNGKRLAIKVLHPEMAALPDIRSRFLTEGYVANRVTHPGTVAVLDDESAGDDSVFLVMELLEGETAGARQRRRGGRMPIPEVLAVADQLLDVLAAAHAAGVVHRDLKPDNVFITMAGAVKVLDFGIARMNQQDSHASHTTQVGVAMGTPAFIAPEQARGRWEMVDALSDQWAVGALMFSLIAGRDVHQAPTMNELLLAAMTYRAPPLASVVAVPPMVAAVVDRALAYEKERRFPDARAMQQAVRVAVHALGQPLASLVTTDLPPLAMGPALPFSGAGTNISVVTEQRTGVMMRPARMLRSIAIGAALAIPAGALLGAGVWWLAAGRGAPEHAEVAAGSAPSAEPAPAGAPAPEPAASEAAPDALDGGAESSAASAEPAASGAPVAGARPATNTGRPPSGAVRAPRPPASVKRPSGPGFLDKQH